MKNQDPDEIRLLTHRIVEDQKRGRSKELNLQRN